MPDENDVQPIYEKLTQESQQWFSKFLLYRNMKAVERSLLGAYTIYLSQVSKGRKKPPNKVSGAWKDAFVKYDWKFRAEQYDAALQSEQEAREAAYREYEAAERERLLSTGLALKEKRIEELDRLYKLIWKSFERSEDEPTIEYKFVSPEKIKEARGCLDDIAKELGHRVSKKELTGKNGGPIVFETEWGGGALADEAEEG